MRRMGLVGFLCLLVMAGLSAVTTPAQAFTLICSGKTKAQVAACDTSGYAKVMDTMHWRMYAGHNCTNYAAYRMKLAGVPEPKILMGNARDWATNARKLGYVVDTRPAVGAIAQWSKAASHVAYVEEVGPGYLVLSEDSYTSKVFRRYKVLATDSWFPEAFIHFKDAGSSVAPMKTTVLSSVTVGVASKVSTTMKPTVTVAVKTSDGKAPVGTVRVRRGGVTVAKAALTATSNGTAKVTIPKLKKGTQWISAVFDGSATVQAGTSRSAKVVVKKPPKVSASKTSVTAPAGQVSSTARAKVTIKVSPTHSRTVTNALSVYVDGVRVAAPKLKKANKGTRTVTLPALTAGPHRITATYWGSKTVKRSYSAARTITVVEPTSVTAALSAPTIRASQIASATATVSTPRGVAPTSGEVWLLVDGVKAASVPLTAAAKGTVDIPLPAIAVGAHQLTLQYRGTTYQLPSAGPALALTVTK